MKKTGRQGDWATGRKRNRDRKLEKQTNRERRGGSSYSFRPVAQSPCRPVFLPARQSQPLQRVGRRIAGCGNLFLGLEAAHGFDGGLVVFAAQFAGVEAPSLERFLNLECARAVDFEGLAPCERAGIIL